MEINFSKSKYRLGTKLLIICLKNKKNNYEKN